MVKPFAAAITLQLAKIHAHRDEIPCPNHQEHTAEFEKDSHKNRKTMAKSRSTKIRVLPQNPKSIVNRRALDTTVTKSINTIDAMKNMIEESRGEI